MANFNFQGKIIRQFWGKIIRQFWGKIIRQSTNYGKNPFTKCYLGGGT